ncbi:hypothetical protein XENOCAPTIV_029492 [Xenoophorus captivus]|uniref:DUF6729 domain-containing protein n=1 Tax=Xenoophorus captivus TaxID=1517983 RepID=A0ABV0QNQ1_9TELE
MLFPAELAYRLSCDKKVLSQMKGRTLGNSANRLHSFLVENHTEEWMTRCLLYLETCGKFQVAGVHLAPTAHPPRMQPVPTSGWLLSTYARETFSRMEELQASVTSVFGSILKKDSTKKVSLTPCSLHSQMKLMSTFTDGWKLPVLCRSSRSWLERMLGQLSG